MMSQAQDVTLKLSWMARECLVTGQQRWNDAMLGGAGCCRAHGGGMLASLLLGSTWGDERISQCQAEPTRYRKQYQLMVMATSQLLAAQPVHPSHLLVIVEG